MHVDHMPAVTAPVAMESLKSVTTSSIARAPLAEYFSPPSTARDVALMLDLKHGRQDINHALKSWRTL
jgi:hypothetical protein